MRTVQRVGPYVDIVEARSPDNPLSIIRLGVNQAGFEQLLHHNLFTAVAQYYGIIQQGLLAAVHAFRGLQRPMMLADDMEADRSVVVYSWTPPFDYVWTGSLSNGKPTYRTPPPGLVLVVLALVESNNEHGVDGTVERWNWVKESPHDKQAPVDWDKRYKEKLWSREL